MNTFKILCLCAFLATAAGGCGERSTEAGSDGAAVTAGPTEAEGGYITGKVTMPDGQTPPTGDIKDISVPIYGVSDASEKVNYSPAVKPDGTFRQKVSGGQYAFSSASITVLYNNHEFRFPLEPVGNLWSKNRDAAEGIAQDFIWHPKGPTPHGKSDGLNIGNHTHWYGLSIGLRAAGWRDDTNQAPPEIPADSKLTFTLKPRGQAIDGSTPTEPVIFERVHDPRGLEAIDLNDLLPAPYEMSGTVTFPDGATRPLLLYDYKDRQYKPTLEITVEKDNIIGGMLKPPVTYLIE